MLGYPQGVKGYKLWCIEDENQKLIVSKDVIFQEEIMPYLQNQKDQNGDHQVSESMDTRFEVESGGITNTEQDDSDDCSDHDINNQGNQQNKENAPGSETNLDSYLLARDRVRR